MLKIVSTEKTITFFDRVIVKESVKVILQTPFVFIE